MFKKLSIFAAILLIPLLAWLAWINIPQDLVKPHFTISKETTYFTSPVDADGYVNYQIALNEHAQQGVTSENNAMVLLLKALGPQPEGGPLPPEYYQRIGVPEPPAEGSYYIGVEKLAKAKAWPEIENLDIFNQWYETTTRRPWKVDQFPRMNEWLQINTPAIQFTEQASRRPRYYSPMVFPASAKPNEFSMMGVLLPCVQRCRDLCNLLLCRAMLHVSNNQLQLAWNDLLTVMRLGRLIAQGPTLIEALVGYAVYNLAADASLSILEQPDLKPAFLEQCTRDLQSLPPWPNLGEKLRVSERTMMLDTFLMFNRHGPGMLEALGGGKYEVSSNRVINSWRNADWDPSLKMLNSWFDRMADSFAEKDRDKRDQLQKEIISEVNNARMRVAHASATLWKYLESTTTTVERHAEVMKFVLTPALQKVQVALDKTLLREQMLRISLALARYRLEKKSYPATLAELSPAWLAAIPDDLFPGSPLIYRKTDKGYLLYSIGLNKIDEDGRNEWSDPRGDDVAFQIPVPPLPKKED